MTRRVLYLLPSLVLAGLMFGTVPGPVAGQDDSPTPVPLVFATNTPPPAPLVFATNTPNMTNTPTYTPTATLTPTETPTDTATPTPTPNGPISYPENVNSLTGLPYGSEEARARRNMLVKISNAPAIVRPQSGLNAADVVIEYEVEGGLTRFAAIFRENAPDHVGPVRSGRLLDFELVPMFDALFLYSGSSDPLRQMALEVPWGHRIISPFFGDNCEEAGFCRFPQDGLAYEHTLYVDTNVAWERATRRGVNEGRKVRGFAFADTPNPGGEAATNIFVNWYGATDARWIYDESSGRYVRYTESVPHYDRADGQQLWTDNIIIIEVPHVERPDLFEPESRSASQEIQLWDTGRAYVFRDGVYYQGYWERKDREDRTGLRLYYGNYVDIMLQPGRSYIEVVRWLGDVDVSTEPMDMMATATQIALSATPTQTPTLTATATAGS